METLSEIILMDMLRYSRGQEHDIDHFLRVLSLSKLIAKGEKVDADTYETIVLSAILHDIACPDLREKYGFCNGKKQEEEGEKLAEAFLEKYEIGEKIKERVLFVISHHHTYLLSGNLELQIVEEADFIANAMENHFSKKKILYIRERVFKTKSGRLLLEDIFDL